MIQILLITYIFIKTALSNNPTTPTNPFSRSKAMSKRNQIFKKSMDILTSDGINPDQARSIVTNLFEKDRTLNKKCLVTNYGDTVMENEDECREVTNTMCQNRTSICSQFNFRSILKAVKNTFLMYESRN